jgi:hypothetical protein
MNTKIKKMKGYLTIQNADGKMWRLPSNCLKTAMNLYQPSSIKGRLLKKYLPVLNYIPVLRNVLYLCIHIIKSDCDIEEELEQLLDNIFSPEADENTYAFFYGTPSVHQKKTIQVSQGKKVRGYCKICANPEVKKLFADEAHVLNYLCRKGIQNIPVCLLCTELSDGTGVFIQSTTKTDKSIVTHELSEVHIQFLTELSNVTKIDCCYTQSDYYKTLNELKQSISVLEQGNLPRNIIQNIMTAITIVEHEISQLKVFSVYHGDFTPWNMFFEEHKLFVFDFEYAAISFPGKIDVFHYFTQVALYEKIWSADRIIEEYSNLFIDGWLKELFEKPNIAYLSYLLVVVEMYTKREKGIFQGIVLRDMRVRGHIIRKLISADLPTEL